MGLLVGKGYIACSSLICGHTFLPVGQEIVTSEDRVHMVAHRISCLAVHTPNGRKNVTKLDLRVNRKCHLYWNFP